MAKTTVKEALEYHRYPKPGKLEITATKPLANQRDLALAYSPGVAEPCKLIDEDPGAAADFTARSNLVAVISNGSAVLGLGNIGALASKPVMEGKAVLFKNFAGIDVFDIEIDEQDPDKLIEVIKSLEPTFGGINLEDIKSPECFMIEGKLRQEMNIPVFHDDQHGTAIIVGAAVTNALEIVDKKIDEVKIVTTGAGASGIACLKLLMELGLAKENILVIDRAGVIYKGRSGGLPPHKKLFSAATDARTLDDAIEGADIFLGLSGPGVLSQDMIKKMAKNPLIFALSNPVPEILPEDAISVRPDAIIATGRSDYPNQVNNVLCFPFIFRGALDVCATKINEEMKIACVHALAQLAKEETPDSVIAAYSGENLKFGPEYLIPKPFDPRLMTTLSPAIARAAMESGVASRPIQDMGAYIDQLSTFVFKSVMVMRPILERAKQDPQRIVYAEGEDDIVLRAIQAINDEGLAIPIAIGRQDIMTTRARQLGLRIQPGKDFEVIQLDEQTEFTEGKIDLDLDITTSIATRLVNSGEVDGMVCGCRGSYHRHLEIVQDAVGTSREIKRPFAMNMVIVKQGIYFICDTAIIDDPTAEEIADIAINAADFMRRNFVIPKAALLSHSSNPSGKSASGKKMRDALQIIKSQMPDMDIDGNLRADAALHEVIRATVRPDSTLKGQPNLLVMPNLDAAKIAYDIIKVLGDAVTIGPILLGINKPVQIMTSSATVRRIINTTALIAARAQSEDQKDIFE